MRKVVRKFIPLWKVEEEEKWLNDMADQGWALISVGFARYEFESCEKGQYTVRLELLEKACQDPASQEYIRFMEDTGAEQVGAWMRWIYFRKKKADGEFEIYSDRASRLKYQKRILQLLGVVGGSNLYIGLYNVWLLLSYGSVFNALGLINLLIGGLCAGYFWKLYRAYQKLKTENELFE